MSVAPSAGSATEAPSASYHGQPVLKAPVWSWEIPNYLFAGGLSGASAGLAYLAQLRGEDELSRRAWITATAAITACPPLLISDLGRPERFIYMLRMFKVTSPMSVGSWILSVSGATTTLAGAHALTGRFARGAAIARPVGALSGLFLATYTAALFANTAVPVWHEARKTLPFVFGAGAALSAAGAVTAATSTGAAAAARRLALGAAAAELATTRLMESRLGMHNASYNEGRASVYRRVSKACIVSGTALVWRRAPSSRVAAVVGGALLCAGAWATRWSVFEAGRNSAADPRYVVEPQRARRAAQAGAAR